MQYHANANANANANGSREQKTSQSALSAATAPIHAPDRVVKFSGRCSTNQGNVRSNRDHPESHLGTLRPLFSRSTVNPRGDPVSKTCIKNRLNCFGVHPWLDA